MRATWVLLLVAVTVSVVYAHSDKFEMHAKLREKMMLKRSADQLGPAADRAASMRNIVKKHFSGIAHKLKETENYNAREMDPLDIREAFRAKIQEMRKKGRV